MKCFPRVILALFVVCSAAVFHSSANAQIASGIDTEGRYPNVVSLGGVFWPSGPGSLAIKCSGSVLSLDETKLVILTAAHCTDIWAFYMKDHWPESLGVSFDLNNQVNGSFSDATYYVSGGIPISFPAKDTPFDSSDYAMVVFPRNATNSLGETIDDRWGSVSGALTPVKTVPYPGYVADIIRNTQLPTQNLEFAAVGYGIGPKIKRGHDLSTFMVRDVARLTFNALNPGNDILRESMNVNRGEAITCNGDSGGPLFYNDPVLGRVQVSSVSGGDIACQGTNTGPGFGTQIALDFVACGKIGGDVSAVQACVNGLFK